MEEKFVCCICGKECSEWGNDPWPVVKDTKSRCCDECNSKFVVPARIKDLYESINGRNR